MGLPAVKLVNPSLKQPKKRYIRKHEDLSSVLNKIKMWPSRTGTLHGIRTISLKGAYVEFTTHCGQKLQLKNSKTSRVSRWLRNKWYIKSCPRCKIPTWKLEKFSSTSFR